MGSLKLEKGSKRVANLYLPKETVQALDDACQTLPFNRSELANFAIREGLGKAVQRFGKFPKLAQQAPEVPA